MSWTLSTLTTAIQDYTQTTEASFVSNITNFIVVTEDRISKSVILPVNRKTANITLTNGADLASLPTDFLAPFEMRINNNGTFTPVEYVDVSLMREAFPNPLMVGVPRWYSMYDNDQIVLAPTPTSGLTGWMNYFYIPESITVSGAGTSWLGTYAPDCLLYGCLSEAYTYLKGEPDLQALYESRYQKAMDGLRKLGEGMEMGDAYRMGEVRIQKGATGAPVSG